MQDTVCFVPCRFDSLFIYMIKLDGDVSGPIELHFYGMRIVQAEKDSVLIYVSDKITQLYFNSNIFLEALPTQRQAK